MKKSILLFLICLIINGLLLAQAPSKFNYQAVVRNTTGNALPNQSVKFKFSILSGSINGTPVYAETNLVSTNAAGLVNINVGSGSVVSGNISTVDWTSNLFFLKIEMDITGGNNFQLMGTQQMVSVPYALDAKIAEKAKDLQLPFSNLNYDAATSFTINNGADAKVMDLIKSNNGGTYPVLNIDNFSTNNNASTLVVNSTAGVTSSFNAGNSGTAAYFNAPGGKAIHVQTGDVGIGTAFPQQRLDVNGGIRIGNSIIQAPGSLRYNGNNFEGYNGTSWIQLNGGGSPDNWGTQAVVTDQTLSGNGTIGSPLSIASQGAANGSVLKWNGTTWAPAVDIVGSGTSDWLPLGGGNIENANSGAVYIGAADPSGKLNVDNGTYTNGVNSSSNDATGSGVYGINTNAGVGITGENFGLGTGVGVKGYSSHGVGGVFTTDDGAALITEQGNVGFGISSPQEKLEIAGAIKIGNNIDLTPDNGTMRYTPTNGFEIRHANNWSAIKNFWNSTNGIDAFNLNSGNVGIGTNTPGAKLEVAGQLKITGGTPGLGKVLTSDANGLASWQTPGASNYTAGTGVNITGNTISNTGDLSNTNEIQALSLTGNTLSLSNGGGSVILPSGGSSQWITNTDGISYATGNVSIGPAAADASLDALAAIGTGSKTISLDVFNGMVGAPGVAINASLNSQEPTSAAVIGASSSGISGVESTYYGVLGLQDNGGIGVAAYSLGGTAMRAKSNTGLAFYSTGNLKLAGIGEAAGKVLTSDANGNATWQTPAVTSFTAGSGINITGNTISNSGDLSNINELQSISKTGNTISLSNGGGSVTDADAQTLSLVGNALSISNGNTITLPSGGGSGTNYWTLNANNHILPNNSGNVLIGADATGSSAAKFEVKQDAVFGKVASFSNTGSAYTTIVDVVDNGLSGNPISCDGCPGNAAIKASTIQGDALYAKSTNGRGIYLKGGNSFGSPAMQIETNSGANLALDLGGQIKIAGGNPGAGKVLTSDANGLATWENASGGASYTAGTGINIAGSNISALNTTALWNSNKLQGNNISSTTPSNGQVLQYSGGQWIPATPAASSNIYDNMSEHFQAGIIQASSTTPEVEIPGLSKTLTITGNAKVIINAQVGMLANCLLCGDHKAAIELEVDGNPYVRSYYSLDNAECTQGTLNKIVQLGPGTHNLKIRLIWLQGDIVTVGNVIGCSGANDVYMDAMVINQ